MTNFDVKIMFHQGSGMGGWAHIYKMVSRVPHMVGILWDIGKSNYRNNYGVMINYK